MEQMWYAVGVKRYKWKKSCRATSDYKYSSVKPKDFESETAEYTYVKRWFATEEEASAFGRSYCED